jgi:hypothetical protein
MELLGRPDSAVLRERGWGRDKERRERGTDRVFSRMEPPVANAANAAMRHQRSSLARAGIEQKGGGTRKKGMKRGWSPVLPFLTGAGEHVRPPPPPLLLSAWGAQRKRKWLLGFHRSGPGPVFILRNGRPAVGSA